MADDRRRLWESDNPKYLAVAVEIFDGQVTLGIHNDVPAFGEWRLVDLSRDDVVTLVSALSGWLDNHSASV